jgi:hypothetical protein
VAGRRNGEGGGGVVLRGTREGKGGVRNSVKGTAVAARGCGCPNCKSFFRLHGLVHSPHGALFIHSSLAWSSDA